VKRETVEMSESEFEKKKERKKKKAQIISVQQEKAPKFSYQ
jgi:hypothetical protein